MGRDGMGWDGMGCVSRSRAARAPRLGKGCHTQINVFRPRQAAAPFHTGWDGMGWDGMVTWRDGIVRTG